MQMKDKTSIIPWKLWEHLDPLDSAGVWFITDIFLLIFLCTEIFSDIKNEWHRF